VRRGREDSINFASVELVIALVSLVTVIATVMISGYSGMEWSGMTFHLLTEFWGSFACLMLDGNAAERYTVVSFKWSAVVLPNM